MKMQDRDGFGDSLGKLLVEGGGGGGHNGNARQRQLWGYIWKQFVEGGRWGV